MADDPTPTPTPTPVEGALTTPPAAIPEPAPKVEPKPLESVLYPNSDPEPKEPAAAAAPEPKPEGESDKPPVESAAPKEGEPPAEAPALTAESYKDLTLPEGLVVDDALFAEAKETFAKVGIDPAKAPELLALYGKTQQAQLENVRREIADQDARWVKELDAIPEFAGPNRQVAQQFVGRAIEEFGTPEVRTILGAYGLSNNPALARFIYNLAYAVVEGEPSTGGSPVPVQRNGQSKPSLAESLYDHPDSQKARTN